MSAKLHLHLDHSQTALTLEIEVEFEWSLSVGHTSLEPHSHEVVINNMTNVWLERLEQLDNLPRDNRNENRNYNFNYEMYDEEQFRSRFRLTKDGFREMLNIIEADISAHNERGNPIPAEIKLLLLQKLSSCVIMQLARFRKHVEICVTYLNRLQVALLRAYLRPLLD